MSKTKRKGPRRDFETRPMERHRPKRQCDGCREWFEQDEVEPDIELGRILGYFCGGCI